MDNRTAQITRKTQETNISVNLEIDGTGQTDSKTGIAFFDHMLSALGKHALFNLNVCCDGDLAVDDHHTVEDVALSLGAVLDQALDERKGIKRFGSAYAPLDEALARVVIDLSGRPFCHIDMHFEREALGTLSTENIPHFFSSFAVAARASLHVDVLRGDNDHHKTEAAFKALALALREAVSPSGSTDIPSTKGVL